MPWASLWSTAPLTWHPRILLLPFSKVLVKLATLTIPDEQEKELAAGIAAGEEEFRLLDPRFLETPGYAVEQCRLVTTHMAQTAREGFLKAMELLDSYDQEKADPGGCHRGPGG